MEKRVEDLEVRNTFQEESIDALHSQLHQQQKEIDALKLEITQLKQLLQQALTNASQEVIDEPPPHY